ncbi:NgoMIV family type II restriction endonuclease [Marinimicrobium sp. ARAG 43.8]|uniref:NgoMIV family type II restriction endonuclease n=1 Tax=Marinimicrobium sp. ARAG 43.8 TaxID=3418719 RepID=UPI003CEFE9D5
MTPCETETSFITTLRANFHRELFERQVLTLSSSSKSKFGFIASNGDSGQTFSATISQLLAEKIAKNVNTLAPKIPKKQDGQRLGNEFEDICCNFVRDSFLELSHLRPGRWLVEKVNTRNESIIARFAQYAHLHDLKKLAERYDDLATFLGNGYTIAPDLVIARFPEPDACINQHSYLVDSNSAKRAMLRQENHPEADIKPFLHASISCKFTMRSDRAQNTRTEALNLIRNRKGRSPHIVAVTTEPTPSRLGSLALGTGDIDCVYHFALYELIQVLKSNDDYEDALQSLNIMIDGHRLKDISDLPLDLAV